MPLKICVCSAQSILSRSPSAQIPVVIIHTPRARVRSSFSSSALGFLGLGCSCCCWKPLGVRLGRLIDSMVAAACFCVPFLDSPFNELIDRWTHIIDSSKFPPILPNRPRIAEAKWNDGSGSRFNITDPPPPCWSNLRRGAGRAGAQDGLGLPRRTTALGQQPGHARTGPTALRRVRVCWCWRWVDTLSESGQTGRIEGEMLTPCPNTTQARGRRQGLLDAPAQAEDAGGGAGRPAGEPRWVPCVLFQIDRWTDHSNAPPPLPPSSIAVGRVDAVNGGEKGAAELSGRLQARQPAGLRGQQGPRGESVSPMTDRCPLYSFTCILAHRHPIPLLRA